MRYAYEERVLVISAAWRETQALRAEPTGLAARDGNRKRTLRQAEEFAQAADVVTYAVKPIQLFYALSQAGRALAAARARRTRGFAKPWPRVPIGGSECPRGDGGSWCGRRRRFPDGRSSCRVRHLGREGTAWRALGG